MAETEPIKTPLTELGWKTDAWCFRVGAEDEYATYHNLIESFGFEIIDHADDQDYQGDSFYILRDGDRWGWCVFGWGSCSGCDAFEAASDIADMEELRKSIFDDIRWFDSRLELSQWLIDRLTDTKRGEDFYWYSKETIRPLIERVFGAP